MKNYILALIIVAAASIMQSCQDRDFEIANPIIAPIEESSLQCVAQGDDLAWSWKSAGHDSSVQVTLYSNGTKVATEVVEGESFIHKNVDTNVTYTYVFKATDGENYSKGVVKEYVRKGASSVTGLNMRQVDIPGGYDAVVSWKSPADAQQIHLTATSESRSIETSIPATESSYTIKDVKVGEILQVEIRANNSDGLSLPSFTSLNIGKTTIGFLSVYPTPEELIANGDDDEACAWLWLSNEYPSAEYLYFGNIKSEEDLEPFRVLFWLRDLEGVDENAVFEMPEVVVNSADAVRRWYTNGGNLLLWQHATPYIGTLGRVDTNLLRTNDRAIGAGFGGYNGDTWCMAVQLHPGWQFKLDLSNHPIFNNLEVIENERTKLIPFKGPGWTEDHNCLYFNLPSYWTGLGNQDMNCYNILTDTYGIYPLGTWDSQIDWISQLNVWEARQGLTEFQGTILCIGNGGCEFSMRNEDGTPDISAYPKNNLYQENVLTLAKNSLEYLKTR